MSKILVTGGSGFIGSNLVRRLSKSKRNEISVFIRNKTSPWRIVDLLPKLDLHIIDITDIVSVKKKLKEIKPDIVYHCATYGVAPFQNNLETIFNTNVFGSINLMQALGEYGDLRKFVNIGSSFEYGPKSKSKAISEMDVTEPNTIYGISKVSQTQFARYFALKDIPIITLRIFTAYGMYEEVGRLIPDIMLSIIRNNTLKISSPHARRDFVFIEDVIDAILKASYTHKIGEIINIGSGKDYSVSEIINISSKITGCNLKISYNNKNLREFDKTEGRNFSNINKAKEILSWKPRYDINKGLSLTYKWFRENHHLYK